MNRYLRRRAKRAQDQVKITPRGLELLELHELEQANDHRERLDGAIYPPRANGRAYYPPEKPS